MTLIFILATVGLLSAVFAAGYSTAIRHTNSYDLHKEFPNTDNPIDAQVRRDLGIE